MTRLSLKPFWNETELAPRGPRRNGFPSLFGEMDRLFEDMTQGPSFPSQAIAESNFSPKVDLVEAKDHFRVEAEIPGVKEKDIEVSFSDGVLKIRGAKEGKSEKKEENYHRLERSFGSFEKWIEFPTAVNANKISASYKSGILTISLPKSEPKEDEVKKIPVKGE